MDEYRVEEHGISCRHLKVDSRVTGVIILHTVVHLIHTTLERETEREREREREINNKK
jgi:hypothetical protein